MKAIAPGSVPRVMIALVSLLVGSALASEPVKLEGHSMSGGASKLTITVTEVEDQRRLIEVHWDEYQRTTLEQVAPTGTGCGASIFDGGREVVEKVERCIDARLEDRHPVYDYEDKTKVRCVFGTTRGDPAAACKLQYSGWFALSPR